MTFGSRIRHVGRVMPLFVTGQIEEGIFQSVILMSGSIFVRGSRSEEDIFPVGEVYSSSDVVVFVDQCDYHKIIGTSQRRTNNVVSYIY